MKLPLLLALSFFLASAGLGYCQDNQFTEVRFHRVHLRNGNFIDGQLISQSPKEVLLKVPSGEMTFRMDMIDHVELVKIKTVNEKSTVLSKPTTPIGPVILKTPGPSVIPTPPPNVKPDALPEAAQNLLDQYRRADVETQQGLMERLIQMGDPVPAFIAKNIAGFERYQVPAILHSLAQTKDARLVPLLALSLDHSDPTLRMNVAMALGVLGDASAIPFLKKSFTDKDPGVRSAAVTAISLLSPADAFDAMLPLLLDSDRDTRLRAISTLHDLATKNSRQRDLGDAIASALSKSSGDVAIDLMFALGRGEHRTSWNALTAFLQDDAAPIRKAAAAALSQLAVPESKETVLAAVNREKNSSVQPALANAVQKLNLLQAGGTLVGWLDEGTPEVKSAVTGALSVLAGQNYGTDAGKWREWWEKAKPQ